MKDTKPQSVPVVVFEPTASQKRAREIMGKNCFGVEEAIKHFGVDPSKQQLAILATVPFPEAMLEERKNTHVLVAVFPISMLGIRSKVERRGLKHIWNSWNNAEKFARDNGVVRWCLVRKTPVTNSIVKTWSEQQELLRDFEEVPSIRVMVYTIIGYNFMTVGEYLFEHVFVFCSDLSSQGSHIGVGYFNGYSLRIGHFRDSDCSINFGLASSMRIPS